MPWRRKNTDSIMEDKIQLTGQDLVRRCLFHFVSFYNDFFDYLCLILVFFGYFQFKFCLQLVS